MTEPNPYMFDGAGKALVAKHVADLPPIRSDAEFAHYARELIRSAKGHTPETPVEARAMTAALLCKMQAYDRLIEAFDRMDAGEI
ncbi:hypothetical protein [Roseivivax sediminis]|uniref:DUF3077 domain-containing protein n=1 Tax=Roseivivax sediminis TaxID=936889 RepID=A0A1I1UHW3_9RHOB|nr:hypothetical protein [Roseivivax sediminis]SFD67520.1 hypothetical protein SAMN04515678_102230 [Roseivivax sediminis]